jgi:hypothetical protein
LSVDSLTLGGTRAEFRVEGGQAAIEQAFAACPLRTARMLSPEPT